MPLITRTYIRTSLVYFVLALLTGLWQAGAPVINLPGVPALRPVYFHLLMLGWVTQLIIGVAHWMFPRVSRDSPRGSGAAAWVLYGLLNGGLLLRSVTEPLAVGDASGFWGWMLAASAVLLLVAGWLFVGLMWPRVKER